VNWAVMTSVVSYSYPTPVYLASALTTCDFINYASGSGPQGYHRQLTMYGGFINIFSSGNSQILTPGRSYLGQQQCACDSLNGARALSVDLIFSGETVGSSSGGGGGGSTTFSQGATAGIAIGVGVGCMLLCLLVFCCFWSGTTRTKSTNGAGWKKQPPETASEDSRASGDMELAHPTPA